MNFLVKFFEFKISLVNNISLICSMLLVFFLTSCEQAANTAADVEADSVSTEKLAEKVKPSLRQIEIKLGNFNCFNERKVSRQDADSALKLTSFILNSVAFQDSLLKLQFGVANYCESNRTTAVRTITGKEVLDSIFQRSVVTIDLRLKRVGVPPIAGKCFGLGSTFSHTDAVSSNYANIKCDMGNLPFVEAYAIHLCHEFAHNVGFCHTDYVDDVAEVIGNIAYHFMIRWKGKE